MASLIAGACFVTAWTTDSGGDEKTHHDCDVFLGLIWGRGKGRKGRGKFKQQRTDTRETTQKAE